ncbi:hypothetical protein Harreka1_72 [Olleya phage Harreka_1]|uniref:Uncharacterized protein n=1 Tax=Olleya phage Harreka_1 TaxID=2745673 RepID=A0A8E4ZFC7_9CAUD|nr:hypothetical protein M1M26_gp72 [Olleya phage Harreka_1]QQV90479.1 hypothetical protein Harreka1_72 [Olleya phage Harreka_1]
MSNRTIKEIRKHTISLLDTAEVIKSCDLENKEYIISYITGLVMKNHDEIKAFDDAIEKIKSKDLEVKVRLISFYYVFAIALVSVVTILLMIK